MPFIYESAHPVSALTDMPAFLRRQRFAQVLWHLQYKMGEGGESLYQAISLQCSDSHV